MISQIMVVSALAVMANAGLLLGNGIGGLGLGLADGYGLGLGGGSRLAIAKQQVVDLWAPPRYEYKYGVEDAHTGDLKEQIESRIGDLTKSQYSLAEKDRQIQVARIVAATVPVVSKGW